MQEARHTCSSRTFTPSQCTVGGVWEVLDDVTLEEVFNRRFPVLQSCPLPLRVAPETSWPRQSGQGRVVSKVGQWADLLLEGHQSSAQGVEATHIGADSIERRTAAACQKIKLGEISRARQYLTVASLAPGTEATFQLLQARRPQVVVRELPETVRAFEPESPVTMDRKIFLKCLKSAQLLRDLAAALTNI